MEMAKCSKNPWKRRHCWKIKSLENIASVENKVSLSKLANFSVPQFPYLSNKYNIWPFTVFLKFKGVNLV